MGWGGVGCWGLVIGEKITERGRKAAEGNGQQSETDRCEKGREKGGKEGEIKCY